jgi:hypothetical protein
MKKNAMVLEVQRTPRIEQCDRCGFALRFKSCKGICDHCGFRLDCSDLAALPSRSVRRRAGIGNLNGREI